ncbi:hypothetical protein [Falsirhodobacter xinxiangensis]|uniref:hypothetical protein n=1 Tax=Falsirhodobacter xinxiangensis TaxID=2530049 RepID=UPI00331302CC
MHSIGGKQTLMGISERGNRHVRRLIPRREIMPSASQPRKPRLGRLAQWPGLSGPS